MKNLLLIIYLVFLSQAHAFVLAKIGNDPIDSSRPTHIIIAGEADQAKFLFQQAALTQGLKYQEVNPQDQVIFIFQHQGKLKQNVSWLQSKNIQVLKLSRRDLEIRDFINFALEIHSIATLDIFSHSAVSYGSKFSEFSRLRSSDESLLLIKSNFTSEAYMVIHGCNSGFQEALRYSALFNIPTFGSLTSTDFQEKLSDGKWYFNNDGDKPAGLELDVNCTNGLCVRMKPVNSVYSGHWGSYSGGGLPFYKVFCENVLPQKCLAAMTRYAIAYVSSSKLSRNSTFEEYKNVVQDMLCPINPSGTARADCVAKLNAINTKDPISNTLKTYSPFRGDQLQCSVLGCEFKFDCSDPKVNSGYCQLINTANEVPTTFMDEYLNYMTAYKYLKYL